MTTSLLRDAEAPVTDRALTDQWLWALDQAERYGKQLAQLKVGDVDRIYGWEDQHMIHTAYSNFLWQFDHQTHHLLRQAFQSGFVTTWMGIQLELLKKT